MSVSASLDCKNLQEVTNVNMHILHNCMSDQLIPEKPVVGLILGYFYGFKCISQHSPPPTRPFSLRCPGLAIVLGVSSTSPSRS